MDHLSRWTLKSLTIGPQLHKTNTQFWEEAFNGLPPLPRVDNVTIVYTYPTAEEFNTDCWEYFDRVLIRRDLFPALRSVQARASAVKSLNYYNRQIILGHMHHALRGVTGRGLLTGNSLAFQRDREPDSP